MTAAPLPAGALTLDSELSRQQAICGNQPPDAPKDVMEGLALLDVRCWDFDGRLHQGQVIVHKALAEDVKEVFEVILETRFPVESVLLVLRTSIIRK